MTVTYVRPGIIYNGFYRTKGTVKTRSGGHDNMMDTNNVID